MAELPEDRSHSERVSTRSYRQTNIRDMEEEPERLLRNPRQSSETVHLPTPPPGFAEMSTEEPGVELTGTTVQQTFEDLPPSRVGAGPSTGPASKRGTTMGEDIRSWFSLINQNVLPRLVKATVDNYVEQESFEERVEEGLLRVLNTWAVADMVPNILTTIVRTEIDKKVGTQLDLQRQRKITARYLDNQPDHGGIDQAPRGPTPRGNGDPGDDDPGGDDGDDFGDSRKDKGSKKKRTKKTKKTRKGKGKDKSKKKKKASKESDSDEFNDES